MTARPPDETIGTAAATELYDLLRIAVDAVRIATWRPGDSLESLLAPAVVAIAAEAGKAVQAAAPAVALFEVDPTNMARILEAMTVHINERHKENQQ